jgi:hypothetical protein
VTRKLRSTAWVILLGLAVFQAYAQRYVIGPDGIAYLDLSDAVVTGHWSRLINLYWSPLYPVLIGIGRVVTGVGPEREIAVVHAVNVLCFAAMLAAFEYMLVSILALAAGRRSFLSGPIGVAGAYILFGCFALTMIPLELTTPDLLNSAAGFAAFGAMLRLHSDVAGTRRHAVALGAALGAGALTKSFMVPWAIVCFATLAFALRRRGVQPIAIAVVVWLAIMLPWSAVLSRAAGRLTFGDTGRLTYAWYVNDQDAPSLGGVPPGTRRPSTDAILAGVGVPGDTVGSDPMWFDPAKWNAGVVPHFALRDQLKTFRVFELFYVQNLTPLLFLFFLIAVAPVGSARESWRRGWIIYVPALAGLAAYSLVIVTTRYVMAFVLAGALTLLATLQPARRVRPLPFLLGLAIPVGLEMIHPETVGGLALVASIVGGMLVGALAPTRWRLGWTVAVVIGLAGTRILLLPAFPDILRAGAAALIIILWRLSYVAVRRGQSVRFAVSAQAALGLLLAAVLLMRFGLRLAQDGDALDRAASPNWGNVSWKIAHDLETHGAGPETRIALIGPHAESYWVRTGRMHIVASVPRRHAADFWALPVEAQDALLGEFAAAGATVAIASIGPSIGAPDSSWTPVKYHGWIKPLAPSAR